MTIAELLKNCPQGMELKCTMWDKVILDHVDMNSNYPIRIKKMGGEIESLTENGCFNFDLGAKCVIFPTDKDTWYGFVPPLNFKDGDIVYFERYGNKYLAIFKKIRCNFLCTYTYFSNISISLSVASYDIKCLKEIRLATEKEKENLFKELKHQGYRWNAETKTLEKLINPKFKVGDIIKTKIKNCDYCHSSIVAEIRDNCFIIKTLDGFNHSYITDKLPFSKQDDWELVSEEIKPKFKVGDVVQDEDGYRVEITEVDIDDECYGYISKIANGIGGISFKEQDDWELVSDEIKPKFKVGDKIKRKNTNEEHTITEVTESTYEYSITKYCDGYITIKSQDEWELVNNKFDITTLVPFETKVLVRDNESQNWRPAIWGYYAENCGNYLHGVVGGSCWRYCIPYEGNEHLIGKDKDCDEFYQTWKE